MSDIKQFSEEQNRQKLIEFIKMLLTNGFSKYNLTDDSTIEEILNAKSNIGLTLLHDAIFVGNTISNRKEIVELLIEKGANINAEDCAGRTPLYIAAYIHDVEMYKFLKSIRAIVVEQWRQLPFIQGIEQEIQLEKLAEVNKKANDLIPSSQIQENTIIPL